MIIRALLIFIPLSAYKSIGATGCANDFQLSVESKAYYERALSRCITESDSYRTTVEGVFETQIYISKCQFQHFVDRLYPIDEGVSLSLQASVLLKVLDQSYGPHLSLCDIIFGAEKLKQDFNLLQPVFGDTSSTTTEEKTSIFLLAKMVDNRCDLNCRSCPKTLCVTKEACAYNVHLGCFSTGQPTLFPTDPIPLVDYNAESSPPPNQIDAILWSQHPLPIQSVQLQTPPDSTTIYTEIFLCSSIGMWIALVVYLIRTRRCKCRFCSYRDDHKIAKNMDKVRRGDRPGEYSEGEVSVCSSTLQVQGFDCEGGTRGINFSRSPTAKSEIFVGHVPNYSYLELAQEAPGEVRPCCLVKSKKTKVNPSFPSKQSRVLANNYNNRDRVSTKSYGVEPSVQTCPPVMAKSVAGIKNPRTETMSRKAFQVQNAVPSQALKVQDVHQSREIESGGSMSFIDGAKSSDEDSGYGYSE